MCQGGWRTGLPAFSGTARGSRIELGEAVLLKLRKVNKFAGVVMSLVLAVGLIGVVGFSRPADAAVSAPGDRHYEVSLSMSECGTLARGSRGPCVRTLQTWLDIVDGADLAIDGRFGPTTERAVRTFQRRFGVPATGRFGPLSRAALRDWYSQLDDEYAPDTSSGAHVTVPLPCQQASANDSCNDALPAERLHTSFGGTVLKSLACNGLGALVGRFNFVAGILTSVVCDVYLR